MSEGPHHLLLQITAGAHPPVIGHAHHCGSAGLHLYGTGFKHAWDPPVGSH